MAKLEDWQKERALRAKKIVAKLKQLYPEPKTELHYKTPMQLVAAVMLNTAIRRRAVLALAAFEGPEVEAAIERALTDTDWQVRQAAEDLT